MAEAIGRPADPTDITKLIVQPVHSDSVLFDDIVVVADGFIILDPAKVDHLQLTVIQQLLELILLCLIHVVVPILHEEHLRHEIPSVGCGIRSCQSFIH